MKEDPAGREAVTDLECQVGARTSNVLQLQGCTRALSARAPNDAKTLTYLWALAVAEGRFEDGRKLAERAKGAGRLRRERSRHGSDRGFGRSSPPLEDRSLGSGCRAVSHARRAPWSCSPPAPIGRAGLGCYGMHVKLPSPFVGSAQKRYGVYQKPAFIPALARR